MDCSDEIRLVQISRFYTDLQTVVYLYYTPNLWKTTIYKGYYVFSKPSMLVHSMGEVLGVKFTLTQMPLLMQCLAFSFYTNVLLNTSQ